MVDTDGATHLKVKTGLSSSTGTQLHSPHLFRPGFFLSATIDGSVARISDYPHMGFPIPRPKGVPNMVLSLRLAAHADKAADGADALSDEQLIQGVAPDEGPEEYAATGEPFADHGARFATSALLRRIDRLVFHPRR